MHGMENVELESIGWQFALCKNLGRIVFLSVDPDGLRSEEDGGGSTYSSRVTFMQDAILQIWHVLTPL